jgi:hypothetical protein
MILPRHAQQNQETAIELSTMIVLLCVTVCGLAAGFAKAILAELLERDVFVRMPGKPIENEKDGSQVWIHGCAVFRPTLLFCQLGRDNREIGM